MWDIVFASGDSTEIQYLGQNSVIRFFRKSPSDKFIRIGDVNNRIIDPGIFISGLDAEQIQIAKKNCDERRARQGKTGEGAITVPDYLAVQTRNPLLVIYPIQLKLPKERPTQEENQVVKLFGKELPVFGFAVGFPAKESADRLTYRANKRKIQEIEASREEPEVDEEFFNND